MITNKQIMRVAAERPYLVCTNSWEGGSAKIWQVESIDLARAIATKRNSSVGKGYHWSAIKGAENVGVHIREEGPYISASHPWASGVQGVFQSPSSTHEGRTK